MVSALLAGLGLGLANGIAPGPTLTLVVSTTLARGRRAGMQVAIAPLLTDLPIVLVTWAIAGSLPRIALAALGLAGAAVLAWFAWEALAAVRTADAARLRDDAPDGRDWVRGATANLLNPAPWLFWATVGAPILVATARDAGGWAVAAFLVAFYVCIVGAKLAVAIGLAATRHRLTARAYRVLLASSALVLAAFAVALAVTAGTTLAT